MSTTARPLPRTSATGAPHTDPADVLVVFGITGDLAKVMTFHSLYRLEQRGLLNCPIVGRRRRRLDGRAPARARAHVHRRVRRARSTSESSSASPRGCRYVSRRLHRRGHLRAPGRPRSATRSSPVFYLEIPPFLFGTVIKQLADAGLTKNARVVVEKPFGHDLQSARALAAEIHQYIEESQLYRIDHFLGKMGTDEFLYLRFGNTMIEPIWNRNHIACVQITMAESFGVEDRGHFYDPVGALRDVVVNHLMQVVAVAAMEAPAGDDAETLKDAKYVAVPLDRRRRPGALRARAVRRLPRTSTASPRTRPPRPTRRCAWRSTTGAGRACRGSSAPARSCRSRRPSCASCSASRRAWASWSTATAAPSPTSSSSSSTPRPARRLILDAHRADADGPAGDHARHGVRRARAARRRPRTRCCCSTRCAATARASPARTASKRRGGSSQPLLERPRRSTPTRPGSWGPAEADELVGGLRRLARTVGGA